MHKKDEMNERKIYCNRCGILLILLFTGITGFAQRDSVAVMKAATKFITAFNHFQWQSFRESFTDDASIFFPEWEFARRTSGRENREKTWLELFPEFKNNPTGDSLTISPRNVTIRFYNRTAVMTFHLGDGVERLSRRTIIWTRQKKTWKIAHLHASFMKKPA